jgi:hypothetical protein
MFEKAWIYRDPIFDSIELRGGYEHMQFQKAGNADG